MRGRSMILSAAGNRLTEQDIIPALRRLGPMLQGTMPVGRSEHDAPALRWSGGNAAESTRQSASAPPPPQPAK
eukprot:11157224-Lingulodinium_polyedra.AAC.1